MKKLIIILFILVFFLFGGCGFTPENHTVPSRIVSSVDVHCQRSSGAISRHYEKPEKVEAVLHYVRMLEPNGPTKLTQDDLKNDFYQITVHLQDGGTRTHQQCGDAFAALHRRYWGCIERSVGLRLGHILTLLPSDELDANRTDMVEKPVKTS